MNQELLTSYFNKAGADRQANKTNTKWKVLQPAADHGPLPSHVLPQVSSREGLAAVPRSTHKEDTQNLLARAAGVLAVCISSGTILFNREIYGSESLSQRYVTMAEAHAAAPKATCCVHDDGCHLLKFSFKRKRDQQWGLLLPGSTISLRDQGPSFLGPISHRKNN